MPQIPFPEDVDSELVESQRPDSLPGAYSHLKQQAGRNVYRSIAHIPDVVRTLRVFIGAGWEFSWLDNCTRELLLLALARELDSAYEWHQHVRVGLLEGLTPEEIKAVSRGEFERFSTTERTVMEFAGKSTRRQPYAISATDLRTHFSDEAIAGMTALISAYVALAVIIDTLGVDTEEPFVGDLENLR